MKSLGIQTDTSFFKFFSPCLQALLPSQGWPFGGAQGSAEVRWEPSQKITLSKPCSLYHSGPALAGGLSNAAASCCDSVPGCLEFYRSSSAEKRFLHPCGFANVCPLWIGEQSEEGSLLSNASLNSSVRLQYLTPLNLSLQARGEPHKAEWGRIASKLVQCMILNSTSALHTTSMESGMMTSARIDLCFN